MSPGQLVVQVVERLPLGVEVDVPVDVHGHLDGAVADDLHDHPRVDTEGEQQGLVFTNAVSMRFRLDSRRVYKAFVEAGLHEQLMFVGAGKLGLPWLSARRLQ